MGGGGGIVTGGIVTNGALSWDRTLQKENKVVRCHPMLRSDSVKTNSAHLICQAFWAPIASARQRAHGRL